jgi:hypothetical protein
MVSQANPQLGTPQGDPSRARLSRIFQPARVPEQYTSLPTQGVHCTQQSCFWVKVRVGGRGASDPLNILALIPLSKAGRIDQEQRGRD